jgi:hypothetical protein
LLGCNPRCNLFALGVRQGAAGEERIVQRVERVAKAIGTEQSHASPPSIGAADDAGSAKGLVTMADSRVNKRKGADVLSMDQPAGVARP